MKKKPTYTTLKKVILFIEKHQLIKTDEKILVAVSGGIDSVCLLDMLYSLKNTLNIRLEAAHLNHMLRGEESDRDEAFVAKLCDRYHISLHIKRVNVKDASKGRSLQDIARQIRYNFLHEIQSQTDCVKIATAHTGSDQAEEVLLRLIRGTSLSGLSGIQPKRADGVIRPLITLTRQEIVTYANENNIAFVEDSSNNSLKYLRNKIRKNLLPIVEGYNGTFVKSAINLAENLCETEDFLELTAKEAENQCKNQENTLNIAELQKLHTAIRKRVYRNAIIKNIGAGGKITSNHLLKIDELVMSHRQEAAYCLPEKVVVQRQGNTLVWHKMPNGKPTQHVDITQDVSQLIISTQGTWQIPWLQKKIVIEQADFDYTNPQKNKDTTYPKTLWIDADKINFPIVIRRRRHGDTFKPFGAETERHLKHFLNSKKIPLPERNELPILICNERIIAIAGVELCDMLKITTDTKNILKISLI